MNTKLAKFLLVSLLSLLLSPTTVKAEEVVPFSDVQVGNSHYVAIQTLKNDGIINGYEDGTFRPKEEITRAAALKIITLATGKVLDEELTSIILPDEPIFTDIDNNAWYSKYLFIAKSKEIVNGYEDGSFAPNDSIKLTETLKIHMKCLNIEEFPDTSALTFIDVNNEGWYAKYIAYAAVHEILDISAKNEIFPDQKMTRGNFAEIVYRLRESYENGSKFGKATFYGKAVNGNGTASGETFDMYALTAAHKTLPFGTIVQVTNLSNGKIVEVKINDRGPFGAGRVIDLSETAFAELASLGTGIINVEYHPVYVNN